MSDSKFQIPLMSNNIERDDINSLISFLQQDPIPQLTNGPKVREFEEAWSKWLGVKHSVFVNSGSSANQLTLLALKFLYPDGGEVIVPPLTWISDIAAVVQNGFTPVFCDINLKNLSFDIDKLKDVITDRTRAVFVTHVLGLNALSDELLGLCAHYRIKLIEDVCESHGATFKNKKAGTFGWASNFSFYFAHHMSTIEGGMVSTNDDELYQYLRAFRSHGMVREMSDPYMKAAITAHNKDLNPDFIFCWPAYNFRSTEMNAVLGLSQLKKLDAQNVKRCANFDYFLKWLDPQKYYVDFDTVGQSNYAFILMLNRNGRASRNGWLPENKRKVESALRENGIEFRCGLSGGGNQMRQPYLKPLIEQGVWNLSEFYNIEHVHNYAWYIGNYPSLERSKLTNLLRILNSVDIND